MPKTVVTQTTVYQFDELSDAAKVKAREWFREASAQDEFWENTYDDAAQIADILGIDLRTRRYKTMGGAEKHDGINIMFSGFWSQGDGACFEGSYSWKACVKAMQDYAPVDKTLHEIAETLTALPYGEGWRASIKHRGHYYHSGCMEIDVAFEDDFYRQAHDDASDKQELPQAEYSAGEAIIIQAMRDFADWIYKSLEAEYEYQNSDENVDCNIRANEYEFTEDGKRA